MRSLRPRLQLTPRVMGWLALDLVGMALFAGGALFLAGGHSLFGRLPTSIVEAAVLLVSGGILMLVAAANLLREVLPHPGGRPEAGPPAS